MSVDALPSTVTVMLPAHNAGEFIQSTLDGLSAQTYPHFRVLISVDKCEDDTGTICQEHARRDPRFQVFQQGQRLGWVSNSNFLLNQASGKYAMFAFHDDVVAPHYIAKLSQMLDAHPELVLTYSDAILTTVAGEQESWVYTALEGLQERTQRGQKILEREGQWYLPHRGLFRLARARQIGGLKHHGAGEFSADWPWLFHMSLLGQFGRVPETLYFKYRKPNSLSRSWSFSIEEEIEVAASCMRELWNSELTTPEKTYLAGPILSAIQRFAARPRS